jgi:hypothetical protein
MDSTFIKECADPSLKPAIVEKFVEMAGSPDPLAITIKSGGRLVLVSKPKTSDEAMAIIRQNIGTAIVRVGLTQIPAGLGVRQIEDLKPSLMDACGNVRAGTTLFAKVLRIVAKWYGNPAGEKAFAQIFDDAIYAWKTGGFEGANVFQAEDPGGSTLGDGGNTSDKPPESPSPDEGTASDEVPNPAGADPGRAEMRIDLSRIGAGK